MRVIVFHEQPSKKKKAQKKKMKRFSRLDPVLLLPKRNVLIFFFFFFFFLFFLENGNDANHFFGKLGRLSLSSRVFQCGDDISSGIFQRRPRRLNHFLVNLVDWAFL